MHRGCQFQPNSSVAALTKSRLTYGQVRSVSYFLSAGVTITEYVKTRNGNTDYEKTSSNVYLIVLKKLPVLANQL